MANPIVTYGTHTLDFNTLPESSLVAMVRRGVSHYLGSEQASKVTGMFKPDADGNVKSDLPDTEENRAAALEDYRAKAIDALIAGTVGVSVRGPVVDPITTIINRLAKTEVLNQLKANGVKPPKKAEDKVKFSDGREFTVAELVARRLDVTGPAGVDKATGATHADRLGKEAKKILDEQKRKAAKAEAEAKSAGLDSL